MQFMLSVVFERTVRFASLVDAVLEDYRGGGWPTLQAPLKSVGTLKMKPHINSI